MSMIGKALREIKTTTGLIGAKRIRRPHEAYLELSSLEIERHRLNQEKKKAESRVEFINARFKEIDRKESVLHRFIKDPSSLSAKAGKRRSGKAKATQIPVYNLPREDIRERTITY